MKDDDEMLEHELFEKMHKRIFGETVQKDLAATSTYILRGKCKRKHQQIRIKMTIEKYK